jgi:hypothetical protein
MLPTEALQASELIRVSPDLMAASLINHYIDLRRSAIEINYFEDPNYLDDLNLEFLDIGTTGSQARAMRVLAIADQSVRLTAVTRKLHRQREELSRIAMARGSDTGYSDFNSRDRALERQKAGHHDDAIPEYHFALRSVRSKQRSVVGDERQLLESEQQIVLSYAGALISIIEGHVIAARPNETSRTLQRACSAALIASKEAVDLVEEIDSRYPLAASREPNRTHISWLEWKDTAYLLRLRALIVIHTAWLLAEGPALDPGEVADISVPEIEQLYRRIVQYHLGSTGLTGVGMNGTWLAMLCGGVIPLVANAPSPLRSLTFLDSPGSVHPTASLDVHGSADWHLSLGDLGNLARFRPHSPAWHVLERQSLGAYSQWRELIDLP